MTARRRRTGAVIAAVATALAAVAIGVALLLAPALWPSPARGLNAGLASLTPEAPVVAVDGADLIDRRSGERLQLVGANWPGFEYACIQGWGLNEGGATDEAVAAMVDWGFTAVRVPLNQQCWFDDRPAVAFGSGEQYRNAVRAWVERLTDAGLIVILDLHWSAPAPALADGLRPMPDADSPRFWAAVATEYRKHQGVLFDLFNEPHSRYDPDREQWAFTLDWQCWAVGGCSPPLENDLAVPLSGDTYAAVGMADLVAAVRATGANQPLLLSGIDYANDLRGWLDAAPDDDQLIASLHAYPGNRCADEACWAADVAPLAERVPVVMAEFGQSDGGDQYVRRAFTWADEHLSGALAWAWWSIPAAESEPNAAFSLVDDALQARAPSGTALRELLAARER
ncbi:cellulase family glycosylhydrolase [Microcella humidisoli]|uniref:Glycoside hydrolase family 5 protein n=1 Tax=Microcella humidisoli TaxID=2963406 RepID=A0ABY5FXF3_9MICO|nr:cellulase family glycosylhydrolase [Microcella humidisoli]UTT62979.1 glycoside hydrolase family 5 protein [Microcella humidisoli]